MKIKPKSFLNRAGTFGLLVDYGIERKISAQSFIAATMTVGIPTGVLLKIRLNRGSQTYFFPLHLSDEVHTKYFFEKFYEVF